MSVLIAPSTVSYPPVVLPAPQTANNEIAIPCWKCGGTGFWCKGVYGKRPFSNTGFVCWACHGAGYKVVARARIITRKPAAAAKPTAA